MCRPAWWAASFQQPRQCYFTSPMSVRSQPAQCSPCEAWSRLRGTSAAAKVKARAALVTVSALVSPDGDAPPLPQDDFVEQNAEQQDSRYAYRVVRRLAAACDPQAALGRRWGGAGAQPGGQRAALGRGDVEVLAAVEVGRGLVVRDSEAAGGAPAVGAGLVSPRGSATAVPAGLPVTDGAGSARGAGVRRRRRQATARPHAVFARFSAEEFEVVSVAAAGVGLTPTGYVASTAVAVARGQVRPVPSGVGDVVRELVEARAQLVRYGVLLNQAVARLNATGQVDGSLVAAAQRCDAATVSVRAATERLGRRR